MDSILLTAAVTVGAVAVGLALPMLRRKPKEPELFDGRTPAERRDIAEINAQRCPDCGSSELLAGPSGGMSQNVLCNSCLMEFNVGFGFGTGAFKVDRTGKASESRARVFGIESEEYRLIGS